jgi:hypothetical protein
MWVRSWCPKKKKNSCALLGSYNICGRQFVGISFFILFFKKKFPGTLDKYGNPVTNTKFLLTTNCPVKPVDKVFFSYPTTTEHIHVTFPFPSKRIRSFVRVVFLVGVNIIWTTLINFCWQITCKSNSTSTLSMSLWTIKLNV